MCESSPGDHGKETGDSSEPSQSGETTDPAGMPDTTGGVGDGLEQDGLPLIQVDVALIGDSCDSAGVPDVSDTGA